MSISTLSAIGIGDEQSMSCSLLQSMSCSCPAHDFIELYELEGNLQLVLSVLWFCGKFPELM